MKDMPLFCIRSNFEQARPQLAQPPSEPPFTLHEPCWNASLPLAEMSIKFDPIDSDSRFRSGSAAMAKKNSQTKKAPPSGFASTKGALVAVGLLCAAAGYVAGMKSETIESRVAALTSREKADAPAPQPSKTAAESKRAESPTIKAADKGELIRKTRAAEPKPIEPKSVEARSEAIPTPPAKPELGGAAAETAAPAKIDAVKSAFAEPPPPIAFALVDREVTQNLIDGEKVTLAVNFENLAGKPIRAFEGVMNVADQQDHPLFSSRISVSALISEGGALRWEQQVDAKKLGEKGRRLVSEDKENLKAVFLVKKVFFVDGSVQKYGAKGEQPHPRRRASDLASG
jgi:hypothetical protein